MAKAKYTYNESRKEWYTLVYDGTLTASGAKHRKRISSFNDFNSYICCLEFLQDFVFHSLPSFSTLSSGSLNIYSYLPITVNCYLRWNGYGNNHS